MIYAFPPTLNRQRDPRWAGVPLGDNAPGSPYTLGGYGCLLTCIANVVGSTPPVLNAYGLANGLFYGGGNAATFDPQRWMPGSAYTLGYVSERYRDTAFPQTEILRLRSHLQRVGPAILEVLWPRTRGQHFVLAVGAPTTDPTGECDRESILIHDPERQGQIEELSAFYGAPPEFPLVRTVFMVPRAGPSLWARMVIGERDRAEPVTDASPEQELTDNGGEQ